MSLAVQGGQVLLGGEFVEGDLAMADGIIVPHGPADVSIDARGLLVLPGLVDLHGDAFERNLQPRPGVSFPIAVAVAETEAQLLANGITTAFHGITLSWEPGLRSAATWTAMLDALDTARAPSRCDMRVHMRWEAFNLPALELALADIARGHVHLVGFNDHTPAILRRVGEPATAAKYAERAGVTVAEFSRLAIEIARLGPGVADAQQRIAAAGGGGALPMASHDDATVAARDGFRAMGARICEFPMTQDVGEVALAAGDWVAMGSPNVLRGGSHLGWASAAALVEAGICRILTSDYYYPAMAQAPFVLAGRGRVGLAAAWALVSSNPAAAAGLGDRGKLTPGQRADVVLVDPGPPPRILATITAGRLAWAAGDGFARVQGLEA